MTVIKDLCFSMKALRQKLSVKKYHQRKDRDFETLLLDHITDGKLWSGQIPLFGCGGHCRLDFEFLFQYFGYGSPQPNNCV